MSVSTQQPDQPDDRTDRSFEIPVHQDIADAIVQHIRSRPKRSQAIALVGAWGSGKSFIVDKVREALKSPPDTDSQASPGDADGIVYRAFVFDAWAHGGDSLARAFLWKLLGFVGEQGEGWISGDHRELLEKKLTHLHHEAYGAERALLTSRTWVMQALTHVSLLGVALFAAWGHLPAAHKSWVFVLASLLILLPMLAWPLAHIFRDGRPSQAERTRRTKSEVLGEPDRQTEITSYESIGPTSFEFEAMFTDRAFPRY